MQNITNKQLSTCPVKQKPKFFWSNFKGSQNFDSNYVYCRIYYSTPSIREPSYMKHLFICKPNSWLCIFQELLTFTPLSIKFLISKYLIMKEINKLLSCLIKSRCKILIREWIWSNQAARMPLRGRKPKRERQESQAVNYKDFDVKGQIGLKKELEFYYIHHNNTNKLFLSSNSNSKVLKYFLIMSNFPI